MHPKICKWIIIWMQNRALREFMVEHVFLDLAQHSQALSFFYFWISDGAKQLQLTVQVI